MTKIKQLRPILLTYSKQYYCSKKFLSSSSNEKDDGKVKNCPDTQNNGRNLDRPMYVPPPDEIPLSIEDIEEPTTCCMSGCSTCVWLDYAEKLSQVLRNSKGDVKKIIMDKVEDPNMRSFLLMELRMRKIVEDK